VRYPIIADTKREVAALLGMLDEDEKDGAGMPVTVVRVPPLPLAPPVFPSVPPSCFDAACNVACDTACDAACARVPVHPFAALLIRRCLPHNGGFAAVSGNPSHSASRSSPLVSIPNFLGALEPFPCCFLTWIPTPSHLPRRAVLRLQRKVFIIGPDRKIKASLSYPTVAGRYFPEIIRLVDALQLGSKYPIATPVGWQKGEDVMIQPSLSDADAAARFPGYRKVELPSGKGYVRMTADPSKTTA